jgi:hypothetical protein
MRQAHSRFRLLDSNEALEAEGTAKEASGVRLDCTERTHGQCGSESEQRGCSCDRQREYAVTNAQRDG